MIELARLDGYLRWAREWRHLLPYSSREEIVHDPFPHRLMGMIAVVVCLMITQSVMGSVLANKGDRVFDFLSRGHGVVLMPPPQPETAARQHSKSRLSRAPSELSDYGMTTLDFI